MKNSLLFVLFICLAGSNAQAQTLNDEMELQVFARRFMAAYNAHDHVALGKMYTDDAVYINYKGNQIVGTQNITNYFEEQFIKNNTTLLIRQTGTDWSDAEHAWVTKGHYEIYGRTYSYDIPINLEGEYVNTMQLKDGVWKIAKSRASQLDLSTIKAEIKAIENAWAAAATAKDVATIMGFYADDAISMIDDQPMLVGKAAIQKNGETEMAKLKEEVTVVYETLDLYGDDKLVTEVGKTTITNKAGKVIYTGKYMVVWEKRDGKWLTIREIVNDDAKEVPAK